MNTNELHRNVRDHHYLYDFADNFLHNNGFNEKEIPYFLFTKDIDTEICDFGDVVDVEGFEEFKHKFITRVCDYFEVSVKSENIYHMEVLDDELERVAEIDIFVYNFLEDFIDDFADFDSGFSEYAIFHFDNRVDIDTIRREYQDDIELIRRFYISEGVKLMMEDANDEFEFGEEEDEDEEEDDMYDDDNEGEQDYGEVEGESEDEEDEEEEDEDEEEDEEDEDEEEDEEDGDDEDEEDEDEEEDEEDGDDEDEEDEDESDGEDLVLNDGVNPIDEL